MMGTEIMLLVTTEFNLPAMVLMCLRLELVTVAMEPMLEPSTVVSDLVGDQAIESLTGSCLVAQENGRCLAFWAKAGFLLKRKERVLLLHMRSAWRRGQKPSWVQRSIL